MKVRNLAFTLLALGSISLYAQETPLIVQPKKPLSKKEVLDSIKASFVHDKMASCIDSLWRRELANLDLYKEMSLDIKSINLDEKVDYELPTELLKERLQKLDEKSPFNIEYNPGLENIIKSFLKNRKHAFERLMGLSQYYFPMFEEALASQNIPLEIKYLAVVESALNPRAVSRVGATGLWQFMYQTGKQYNLNISSYVDDRCDPLKASNAATQYMTNMYAIFGDWDLVLASYNSGPGNVAKAIRRSGGKQNYWNIRKFLPKETQGYLPAFLATMYIFEYHKEHGIKPEKAIFNHFASDTIRIKQSLTFKQLSDLLDVSEAELQFLNPSFKRNEIPFVTGVDHYLRLPVDKIAIFTSNEDKIYAYASYEYSLRERPFQGLLAQRDSIHSRTDSLAVRFKYHKVRRGDSLGEISAKYGVAVSDLKKWNHLRSDKAPRGRRLKIVLESEAIAQQTPKKSTPEMVVKTDSTAAIVAEVAKTAKVFKEEKVVSKREIVKTHKVKSGENLALISEKYGVTVADIKKWNHLKSTAIAAGKRLSIHTEQQVVAYVKKEVKPTVDNKVDKVAAAEVKNVPGDSPKDYYEVQKGDNLFTIAKKFNVTIEELKSWNSLNDTNIQLGSKLTLNQKPTETTTIDTANTASKKLEYVVLKGDNLGAIARKYQVSVADLKLWNQLENNALKVGQTLLIASSEVQQTETNKHNQTEQVAQTQAREKVKLYYVKRGDSLFSISKKYPGVTISDLKKWNGIKGESLTPGMKLRING